MRVSHKSSVQSCALKPHALSKATASSSETSSLSGKGFDSRSKLAAHRASSAATADQGALVASSGERGPPRAGRDGGGGSPTVGGPAYARSPHLPQERHV